MHNLMISTRARVLDALQYDDMLVVHVEIRIARE